MIDTIHPVERAERWVDAFSKDGLENTIYARQLVNPLAALVNLHKDPMPWKVRLSVLVTGRIPKSYLEDFE